MIPPAATARVSMLRYRNQDWLVIHGATLISVRLPPAVRGKQDVRWQVKLRYVRNEPEWQRLPAYRRQSLEIVLCCFAILPGDWRHFGRLDFWNTDEFAGSVERRGGYCETRLSDPAAPGEPDRELDLRYFQWRIARAKGTHFDIELAGGSRPPDTGEAARAPTYLTGDQAFASASYDRELYLLETVPFGEIRSTVPRNAPDPYRHAEALAHRHLNIPPAEYIQIWDHSKSDRESLRHDLHANIHIGGYYED